MSLEAVSRTELESVEGGLNWSSFVVVAACVAGGALLGGAVGAVLGASLAEGALIAGPAPPVRRLVRHPELSDLPSNRLLRLRNETIGAGP